MHEGEENKDEKRKKGENTIYNREERRENSKYIGGKREERKTKKPEQ